MTLSTQEFAIALGKACTNLGLEHEMAPKEFIDGLAFLVAATIASIAEMDPEISPKETAGQVFSRFNLIASLKLANLLNPQARPN